MEREKESKEEIARQDTAPHDIRKQRDQEQTLPGVKQT